MTNPRFATLRSDGRKLVIFEERQTVNNDGDWVHQYGIATVGSNFARMGIANAWVDAAKVDIQ